MQHIFQKACSPPGTVLTGATGGPERWLRHSIPPQGAHSVASGAGIHKHMLVQPRTLNSVLPQIDRLPRY